ncbi:MAG: HYR domain-containing protein [Planctomycetes bacterium]|nr:HYR domain-containing protein [Planctomycetota bacterium]
MDRVRRVCARWGERRPSRHGEGKTEDQSDGGRVRGRPAVLCIPPSGSLFPMGMTIVTCTATDASGNQSQCTFPVIVRPTIREHRL